MMCSLISEGKYTLKNICGMDCPCHQQELFTHLNAVKNTKKDELPEIKYINIRGREEHEAVIRDAELCKELGLDQIYEVMVYLKRWGGWLGE